MILYFLPIIIEQNFDFFSGFRKWKFKVDVFKRKETDKIIKTVAPPGQRTFVGIGILFGFVLYSFSIFVLLVTISFKH